MRRFATPALAVLSVCLFAASSNVALAADDKANRTEECDFTNSQPSWDPSVRRTDDNTFIFNHRDLRADGNQPYVLNVADGGYFQVLFKCTAPAFFTYTITGDQAAQPDSASGSTLPESVFVSTQLTTRGVTMRHISQFARYHITAKVREGLQQPMLGGRAPRAPSPPLQSRGAAISGVTANAEPIQLYSVAFDLWVITKPEWQLSIIAGVADSSLVDKKYAIATDDKGNQTFVENAVQDTRHIDMMALANVYYPQLTFPTLHPGFAFGLGTSGTSPRFFFGPSVVFGRYFVFTGGWSIGSVAAPPAGQGLNQKPINGANTLNSLSSQITAGGYIGIGFTWIDRHDQFGAGLSATASASGIVASCVTSVKPDAVTFDATGNASSPVTIEAADDCAWTATLQTGDSGFKVGDGASAKGTGNGTIHLSADPAIAEGRADVLNVAGPTGSAAKTVKLTQGSAS